MIEFAETAVVVQLRQSQPLGPPWRVSAPSFSLGRIWDVTPSMVKVLFYVPYKLHVASFLDMSSRGVLTCS